MRKVVKYDLSHSVIPILYTYTVHMSDKKKERIFSFEDQAQLECTRAMLLFPIKQKWSTKTASQKLHKKERARLRTCIVKSKPMKKISTYKISNQFNSHIHKIVYSKVRDDRLCIKISKLT